MKIPNYKYAKVRSVKIKKDFEIHKHDEEYNVTETVVLPKGTFGVIESMGCESIDDFENHYDVIFKHDSGVISVKIYEKTMEDLLELKY